ncbi:MerR family transcriptional regulator [Kitasatospora sp. SUK 42]|uniref:MerR family transcriptional regulator n=1 Tax=Kitasatospora sp. SUK 42 TaxID=1588882 RepID=UPI0018C8E90A|nr:MerR family transcriptional regulator [Kitasatospora sp. SUK 42]MBV2155806.1 MerR family transcriptional regulator [Kitasatospora sp. SUK 42]
MTSFSPLADLADPADPADPLTRLSSRAYGGAAEPTPHAGEGTLRIGEMVDRTGVSERLLRYYESRGLLEPSRTPQGHRLYRENDVSRVRLIRVLIDGRISTKNIQLLIDCVHDGLNLARLCGELDDTLDREFERISDEIRSLELTRRYIAVLSGRIPSTDWTLASAAMSESPPSITND